MKVLPYGNEYQIASISDIFSVSFSVDGLEIKTELNSDMSVKIMFPMDMVRGFRYLDEGDLYRYFKEGMFNTPHLIYEIIEGGWSNGEMLDSNMLGESTAIGIREWFITTENGCMSVLSGQEPSINEI